MPLRHHEWGTVQGAGDLPLMQALTLYRYPERDGARRVGNVAWRLNEVSGQGFWRNDLGMPTEPHLLSAQWCIRYQGWLQYRCTIQRLVPENRSEMGLTISLSKACCNVTRWLAKESWQMQFRKGSNLQRTFERYFAFVGICDDRLESPSQFFFTFQARDKTAFEYSTWEGVMKMLLTGKKCLTLGNYAGASPDWTIKTPFLSVWMFWPESDLSRHDKPSEIWGSCPTELW